MTVERTGMLGTRRFRRPGKRDWRVQTPHRRPMGARLHGARRSFALVRSRRAAIPFQVVGRHSGLRRSPHREDVGHARTLRRTGITILPLIALAAATTMASPAPTRAADAQGSWQQSENCDEAHGLHSAIYDSDRQQMVVFGGYTMQNFGNVTNETWVLSLGVSPTWSLLTTQGTPPAARTEAAAIYDPVRQRMLIFGGTDGMNDLWQLSLVGVPTWQNCTPVARRPRPRETRRSRQFTTRRATACSWSETASGRSISRRLPSGCKSFRVAAGCRGRPCTIRSAIGSSSKPRSSCCPVRRPGAR